MPQAVVLPLLPLRDVVVYPHMVIPLFVGRAKSISALEQAMAAADKQILLIAQRNATNDDPCDADIYRVGTVATILQLLKLPDGTVKVLIEGGARVCMLQWIDEDICFRARIEPIEESKLDSPEADALVRTLMKQFEQYVSHSKKAPNEVMGALMAIDDPSRLADTIATYMPLDMSQKQAILEMADVHLRIEHLLAVMGAEIDLFQVEKRIRGRVKKQMDRSQREYYLNEQMKAIQKELTGIETGTEVDETEKKIADAAMPKAAETKVRQEATKLKMMAPMSAEASVVRSYIDWMTSMPWQKQSRLRHNLKRAEDILNRDHYGLDEVKERILEYLAVQQRVGKVRGQVLCLVGPPGVGKTSLGESIANATGRKFVRMALGGMRDEAEIRGHRRTYIGSMPGKLLQKLSKLGVNNPLFLLDEIDKIGMDHRGDPASALLEVLDPEQNKHFNDHYLDVDYDLSNIMFICTSNSTNIPGPLLDRMEIIRIPGYTEDEKLNIASRYLLPKQFKLNGLREGECELCETALRDLIRYYTREAGVRNLEREIAKICRKIVARHTHAAQEKNTTVQVTEHNLENFSGVRKFNYGRAEEENKVGQVTGLAWTEVGGELLTIEAAAVKGRGVIIKTGKLGDVMQESIQAALTVVRSRSQTLGIPANFHETRDLHIHVPEGATPKDGPSAGVGMCTALVSVLTNIPVRADVAMTGEITLRGQVLPIGGLKEKLLAAHRGGIRTVIIPQENERDLKEIPDNIKNELLIKPVKWIDDVLELALQYMPQPLSDEQYFAIAEHDKNKKSEEIERICTH